MEGFNEKLNQYKLPIALSIVGFVLIVGGIFSSGLLAPKPQTTSAKDFPKESLVKGESLPQVKVDLSGAVVTPGVYSLAKESRIEDVIKLAGGFHASASAEYISKNLNLSQKIIDGQKIYIPFTGERVSEQQALGEVAGAVAGKVGINSGTQAQLESLPGIGPATASKIMASRPYQDLNELVSKKAVGKATFEKIKDLVDLN